MQCSKCGEQINEENFCVYKPGKCLSCQRQYMCEYRRKNREKLRKQAYDRWIKNKDKILHKARKKRLKNHEQYLDRERKNADKNKEKNRKKMRKYRDENREKVRENQRRYREKNKQKVRAYAILHYHKKTGKIIPPDNCEYCGKIAENINGHHVDYTKPLEVFWLCDKCHKLVHKVRKSLIITKEK